MLQFIATLLQLQDELVEAFIDVARLLVAETLDLGLDVVHELPVVVVDALRIDHQLVQVVYVLLDDIRDVLKLSQLVAIVIGKHALRAHNGVAELAEVLDLLVEMLEAVDFTGNLMTKLRCLRLGHWYGALIINDTLHARH